MHWKTASHHPVSAVGVGNCFQNKAKLSVLPSTCEKTELFWFILGWSKQLIRTHTNTQLWDLGVVSIERCRLTSIGTPMSKIKQSRDHLIFNMRIPIPGKDCLDIEMGPCPQNLIESGNRAFWLFSWLPIGEVLVVVDHQTNHSVRSGSYERFNVWLQERCSLKRTF